LWMPDRPRPLAAEFGKFPTPVVESLTRYFHGR
jgi:hypothetical protein